MLMLLPQTAASKFDSQLCPSREVSLCAQAVVGHTVPRCATWHDGLLLSLPVGVQGAWQGLGRAQLCGHPCRGSAVCLCWHSHHRQVRRVGASNVSSGL